MDESTIERLRAEDAEIAEAIRALRFGLDDLCAALQNRRRIIGNHLLPTDVTPGVGVTTR